jgi:hypothetical protein
MQTLTWKSLAVTIPLVGLAVTLVAGHASASHRHRSDVLVTNGGGSTSNFCTDGDITVVHTAKADAYGSYSVGYTVLQGSEGTFHVGQGSRIVPRGCYAHWLANTSAIGRASVQSTVWYD